MVKFSFFKVFFVGVALIYFGFLLSRVFQRMGWQGTVRFPSTHHTRRLLLTYCRSVMRAFFVFSNWTGWLVLSWDAMSSFVTFEKTRKVEKFGSVLIFAPLSSFIRPTSCKTRKKKRMLLEVEKRFKSMKCNITRFVLYYQTEKYTSHIRRDYT